MEKRNINFHQNPLHFPIILSTLPSILLTNTHAYAHPNRHPPPEPTPRRAATLRAGGGREIYVRDAGAGIPYDALGGGDADAEAVAQGVQKGV